jgi:hypothetical protein
MPNYGKHMTGFGWVYNSHPPCADYAPKDLKRGRTRRRILRWLKVRSERKLPLRAADFSQALPLGVRVEVDRDTGYAYVAPVPNRGRYDDLGAARGMLFALLLSIPMWIAIAYVVRCVYHLIAG